MFQKELEAELKKLSNEFKELKSLTEKRFKKYKNLENRYEKCLKLKQVLDLMYNLWSRMWKPTRFTETQGRETCYIWRI